MSRADAVATLTPADQAAAGKTPKAFRDRLEGLAMRLERTAYAAA